MKIEEIYNEWKSLFPLSDIVTFSEMAEQLSVNRSAVQKQIEGFRKKGYLDRRDDGSWHVLALNSRVE